MRNPVSPEPTVQANDVAFAAHAALLSVLVLSMFWGRLWGFKQVKRNQAPSRGIMGIGLGCVVSVLWVVGLVIKGGGEDARGWAWIDVVSGVIAALLGHFFFSCLWLIVRAGVRRWLFETGDHGRQIYTASLDELQAQIYDGLEHLSDFARFGWRSAVDSSTSHRLESAGRLDWADWKSSQVCPG